MPRIPRARPRSRSTRRRALVLLIASTLIVGCATSSSEPDSEASLPEQWFAARTSAQRQGVENLVRFYDPDVMLDHRALGGDPVLGRTEALEYLNAQQQPFHDSREPTGPLYLSGEAALTTETVTPTRQSGPYEVAVHSTMGPAGAVSEMIAASVVSWRTHFPRDERSAAAQALALDYVQAWAQQDADRVRALYQPDAVVTDSLAGVTARGAAQVADLASAPALAGGLGTAVVDQLPDYGGPAVFAGGRPFKDISFDTIALLMTLGAPDACPHRVATVLQLGRDGLVQAEERFQRVDDLQRCSPDGSLPPGWWDSAVVPDPVPVERTGTLVVGDLEIEVYNGTPGLEELITWSFAQFRAKGLGTPTVRRVTFHNNRTDKCEDFVGLILSDAVTLCFESAAACQDQDCTTWKPWAKQTTLHELAHAWMVEHLTPEVIDQFKTATAMPTWSSSEHPWGQRGVELAAETIAWATSDQPVQVNPKLGSHTCDELARYYEILTGRPPEPTPPGCEPPHPTGPAHLDIAGSGRVTVGGVQRPPGVSARLPGNRPGAHDDDAQLGAPATLDEDLHSDHHPRRHHARTGSPHR